MLRLMIYRQSMIIPVYPLAIPGSHQRYRQQHIRDLHLLLFFFSTSMESSKIESIIRKWSDAATKDDVSRSNRSNAIEELVKKYTKESEIGKLTLLCCCCFYIIYRTLNSSSSTWEGDPTLEL